MQKVSGRPHPFILSNSQKASLKVLLWSLCLLGMERGWSHSGSQGGVGPRWGSGALVALARRNNRKEKWGKNGVLLG